jgi:uncharacterized damage-inducible protein DinB
MLEAHFVRLAGNNHWSNHRLYRACAQLDDEEYFRERRSFFGSIHATLNHIVIVDRVYLGRLDGVMRVASDCAELHADFASLREAQVETDRELLDYCARLDPRSLAAQVSFRRTNGQEYRETVAAILTHLFLHQVHHRGQVHDMLSATRVAPPQLDEFFLSGDRALRAAELDELGLPRE